MSGVGQAVFMNQRSFIPPPFTVIGGPSGGGFWAGDISTTANSVATHHLVIGPLSTAQAGTTLQYKNAGTDVGGGGAGSFIDGPQNTADMVADGNSTVYPAAHFCNNLSLGGFSDWYMPAKNELEVCYRNLKPTTQDNGTSFGINANAVPARASNYTSGDPAQTSVAAFQDGNSEAFTDGTYWTSTAAGTAANHATFFGFSSAFVSDFGGKTSALYVRAIRRVAV
jgi:hypothetical protein